MLVFFTILSISILHWPSITGCWHMHTQRSQNVESIFQYVRWKLPTFLLGEGARGKWGGGGGWRGVQRERVGEEREWGGGGEGKRGGKLTFSIINETFVLHNNRANSFKRCIKYNSKYKKQQYKTDFTHHIKYSSAYLQ